MNKFVYNTCMIILLILSWIMIAGALALLGGCVFYTTYVTLELPDYSFLIYTVVGCIIMIYFTIKSIKTFAESKAFYDNHIKERFSLREETNMVKIWFRVGMEAKITKEELDALKVGNSEELMMEIIKRAELSGETYIPEKFDSCEDYDNPDKEIDFLF